MSKDICLGKIDLAKVKTEEHRGPNKIMKPKGSGWVEIPEDEYYDAFANCRERERLEKLANGIGRQKKKRSSSSKKKEDKLVVTNYDNFANASFFIDQYYKAKDMLEEVDKFFKSFIMSRLIAIEDLNKHKINAIDKGEWLDAFKKVIASARRSTISKVLRNTHMRKEVMAALTMTRLTTSSTKTS